MSIERYHDAKPEKKLKVLENLADYLMKSGALLHTVHTNDDDSKVIRVVGDGGLHADGFAPFTSVGIPDLEFLEHRQPHRLTQRDELGDTEGFTDDLLRVNVI